MVKKYLFIIIFFFFFFFFFLILKSELKKFNIANNKIEVISPKIGQMDTLVHLNVNTTIYIYIQLIII